MLTCVCERLKWNHFPLRSQHLAYSWGTTAPWGNTLILIRTKTDGILEGKLIFSPLKLVFQIALCFSQILFHKCKILTLCHLHCMIWMYNIRKFSIYTNRLYLLYFCHFVIWNVIYCFLLHVLFTLKFFFWLHRI